MKFKKLLTVLGCFVLVLMCAFTVVGCGEVAATAEEINTFFADSEVVSSFDGVRFDGEAKFKDAETFGDGYVKYSGEVATSDTEGLIGKIYVEFSVEDENSGMTYALKTTYYLKNNKLYNEKTKKYSSIGSADMMTPMMFGMVQSLASDAENSILGIIDKESDDVKLTLQKKGDAEKGNVTFIATAEEESNKTYAYVRYENKKVVELVAESNEEGIYSKTTIKAFDGKVNLPDLSGYTEVSA